MGTHEDRIVDRWNIRIRMIVQPFGEPVARYPLIAIPFASSVTYRRVEIYNELALSVLIFDLFLLQAKQFIFI